MVNKKQTILSGMRPTGELHLGHYFSVIKNWARLQDEYRCFYMIADLHALTTLEDAGHLKENSLKMAALWMAAGIDPRKSVIFRQSDVPEHSELSVILSMLAPVSMLELNPTYKEMLAEHPKANNLGLLSYPVLQAADILLYKAVGVPIGKDQEPHLELTRELARKFNNKFKKIFVEPKAMFDAVPKIMSLQDPFKKMSKSHSEDSYISLLDSPEIIRKKIKRAVTDSGSEIKYLPQDKPALANLITLYNLSSGENIKDIEKKFAGKGYAEFKEALAEVIIKLLLPTQERYAGLIASPDKIQKTLDDGARAAKEPASQTLREAKIAMRI